MQGAGEAVAADRSVPEVSSTAHTANHPAYAAAPRPEAAAGHIADYAPYLLTGAHSWAGDARLPTAAAEQGEALPSAGQRESWVWRTLERELAAGHGPVVPQPLAHLRRAESALRAALAAVCVKACRWCPCPPPAINTSPLPRWMVLSRTPRSRALPPPPPASLHRAGAGGGGGALPDGTDSARDRELVARAGVVLRAARAGVEECGASARRHSRGSGSAPARPGRVARCLAASACAASVVRTDAHPHQCNSTPLPPLALSRCAQANSTPTGEF